MWVETHRSEFGYIELCTYFFGNDFIPLILGESFIPVTIIQFKFKLS